MTDKLKEFCDKLKMLLNSMKHRDELILKSIDKMWGIVFEHEIKIEKLHNENLPNVIPFLMLDNKVVTNTGRRILIESYTFVETLMLNTVYYYGGYKDGSFGMDANELEFMERTRLTNDNSIVNFDSLFEQINLAAVKYL